MLSLDILHISCSVKDTVCFIYNYCQMTFFLPANLLEHHQCIYKPTKIKPDLNLNINNFLSDLNLQIAITATKWTLCELSLMQYVYFIICLHYMVIELQTVFLGIKTQFNPGLCKPFYPWSQLLHFTSSCPSQTDSRCFSNRFGSLSFFIGLQLDHSAEISLS